ncbi:MAG: hypothetical protein M1812_003366 [Candelaria pacifica]|nr:MAG: hypothetical protein M1812_003366 [Candelaria pacifica]
MIFVHPGRWLRPAAAALLLLAFVIGNSMSARTIPREIGLQNGRHAVRQLSEFDRTAGVALFNHEDPLQPRADDNPVKCKDGDDPYADENEEETEVPDGDTENIYRPPNESMELPDDDADYGDDRFPPYPDGTPKRGLDTAKRLAERLPTTLMRKIKDRCLDKLYATAWARYKPRMLYFAEPVKRGSKLLTLSKYKGETGDLKGKQQEIDHNVEFQEIRGLLKGPKPDSIPKSAWDKAYSMVDDGALDSSEKMAIGQLMNDPVNLNSLDGRMNQLKGKLVTWAISKVLKNDDGGGPDYPKSWSRSTLWGVNAWLRLKRTKSLHTKRVNSLADYYGKAAGCDELRLLIKKQLPAFRSAVMEKVAKDLKQEKFNGKAFEVEDLDKRQWDGTDGKRY